MQTWLLNNSDKMCATSKISNLFQNACSLSKYRTTIPLKSFTYKIASRFDSTRPNFAHEYERKAFPKDFVFALMWKHFCDVPYLNVIIIILNVANMIVYAKWVSQFPMQQRICYVKHLKRCKFTRTHSTTGVHYCDFISLYDVYECMYQLPDILPNKLSKLKRHIYSLTCTEFSQIFASSCEANGIEMCWNMRVLRT